DKDSDSDDSDNGGKGSGSSPTGGHKSPKTGDENSMGLWIALLAAALLGTGGVFAVRRRK
ncbi:MAG: LPXTG cell wall anchor domain-containing protein, partial [Mogibacterium sp.]|nr:LPXTG cell wall anchor domain-containing protein [Mogibacterium sp.]